jgi:hypothetical protein
MTSPGSAEQVTVSLRCDEAGSAAAVAGHVTLAMAIRAGLPPLTADRARGNLATALAECEGPLEMAWAAGEGYLYARIGAPSEVIERLASLLAEHAPVTAPSQLELRFVRAGLRSV